MMRAGHGQTLWTLIGVMGLGVAAGTAAAGTVSTGGGTLYEETANPWFLENTKTVSYCIDSDAEHMLVKPELIEQSVHRALAAWQVAFRAVDEHGFSSDPKLVPYGKIRLATQEFKEEACAPSTDLRFQIGTLTADQRQMLESPRHFVATTIRTDYDLVQLRGKGFIYVSPAAGSLRPTAINFADSPWSACDGCLLQRALMHELGHVFGLTHDGNQGDLMGARHLESMTRQTVVTALTKAKDQSGFVDDFGSVNVFSFPARSVDRECQDGQPYTSLNKFFHIPADWSCVNLVLLADPGRALEVYAAPHKGAPLQLIGAGDVNDDGTTFNSDGNIQIKLSPQQRVFVSTPDGDPSGYLDGPQGYTSQEKSFVYQTVDGSYKASALLRLTPNAHFELFGQVDGVTRQILSN